MISCRHPISELQKASEIRVDYKDLAILSYLVTDEWTCTADIVIYIPSNQMVEWERIDTYKETLNIIIAAENTDIMVEAQSHGYHSFWSYPVSSFWELNSLLSMGVSQVLLDAPLYFDLYKVKTICGDDVEIRLCANACMNTHLPHEDGICGPYIRPEDIDAYADYVDHIEFETVVLSQELTLVNIYQNKKEWPGNLNILLNRLHANIDNRGLDNLFNDDGDDKFFAHRRMNCGQVCQENPNRCHFCTNAFSLVNTIRNNQETLQAQLDSLS